MAATLTFDVNKNQIKSSLDLTKLKYRKSVTSYMVKKAKELELYMKANHPWQNRTGDAEAKLSAKVTGSNFNLVQTIELAHGVPYGVYLEYSMGRRFAIIEPTIRLKGHEIVNGLQNEIGIFVKVKEV